VDDPARRAAEELHARDRALVAQCLAGDLDAFNRIVELYQDYLFALTVRVVGDREAAADATQEAFFNAYRNLSRFRGDSFRSWLTRIALNAATDVLRVRKRRPRVGGRCLATTIR
jgi:RNA polymerase sigma-70 factor (ECF subfamily)